MKRPNNYRPEYSLSIAILASFLSKSELKNLIDSYVKAKIGVWRENVKGKK